MCFVGNCIFLISGISILGAMLLFLITKHRVYLSTSTSDNSTFYISDKLPCHFFEQNIQALYCDILRSRLHRGKNYLLLLLTFVRVNIKLLPAWKTVSQVFILYCYVLRSIFRIVGNWLCSFYYRSGRIKANLYNSATFLI